MWWKQNRWKVIVPILIAALLAAAFWAGGGPEAGDQTAGSDKSVPAAYHTPAGTGVTASAPGGGLSEQAVSPEPSAPGAGPEAEAAPSATHTAAGDQDRPEGAEGPAENGKQDTPAPADSGSSSGQQGMDIDPATGRDQYLTAPVPEGKPAPAEPQDTAVSDAAHTCTLSVRCDTILDNMDALDPEKAELVPEDGIILAAAPVTFYEGESVFNVLQRELKRAGIHMEFKNTPIYNSAYIEGIQNLYEFDCGELSGWMYKVNGWFPNYGCSRYQLQEGDVVEWVYTCDLGDDVGGRNILDG